VTGTDVPLPTDPAVRQEAAAQLVACNQLWCAACRTPVKHLEGAKIAAPMPDNLDALYDDLDPDAWIDLVELNDAYRLYFCRCGWYSTAGGKPAPYLDTVNIDHWHCAGHPPRLVGPSRDAHPPESTRS